VKTATYSVRRSIPTCGTAFPESSNGPGITGLKVLRRSKASIERVNSAFFIAPGHHGRHTPSQGNFKSASPYRCVGESLIRLSPNSLNERCVRTVPVRDWAVKVARLGEVIVAGSPRTSNRQPEISTGHRSPSIPPHAEREFALRNRDAFFIPEVRA